MHQDVKKILITEEDIVNRTVELGRELTAYYEGKNPIVLGILKGASFFMTDLVRHIETDLEMDFMAVSSYGSSTTSSGEVRILKDLNISLEGRDVLIVEDIIDTGLTLSYLMKSFKNRGAKDIKICTLLWKTKENIQTLVNADYIGFTVPDEFVVGYGLDFDEKYRNLPYIGVLKEEVYS